MYIYMLEVEVTDGDKETKEYYPWSRESRLFTDARNINDVKRYAKYFIQEAIDNLETNNPEGYFNITTRRIGDIPKNTVFDRFMYKYDNYIQHFSLTGDELDASFKMNYPPYRSFDCALSMYFNPDYIPRFKIGDIVYYNDDADYGEYVIVTSPKPILTTNENNLQVFYSIKGYAEQWEGFTHYDDTDYVMDKHLKIIPDNEVRNLDIFILRDFILGKRSDIETVIDDGLQWIIKYKREEYINELKRWENG